MDASNRATNQLESATQALTGAADLLSARGDQDGATATSEAALLALDVAVDTSRTMEAIGTAAKILVQAEIDAMETELDDLLDDLGVSD